MLQSVFFFFFQAEDGIRDTSVTGVQTCALPIWKELVARSLHRLSAAASEKFVVCNCSTLVENLAESELFGYVKGAFTGAIQDRAGLFENADGDRKSVV